MRKVIISAIISVLLFSGICIAQSPPHPNGGSAPGSSATPVGGGSPISGGLIFMLIFGAGYAAKKGFDLRKELMD
ncbi:MAG: hypothetical protein K9H49_02310 [Bacteroidales bacterium]|nr:hypothetical protein [Bacteroidales bacterium]MCF8403402.1 hypothetical protein [Bacteroidales bacterium]